MQKKPLNPQYLLEPILGECGGPALAIRKHWAIENGLHWSLDVGFREDRQIARKMNLAENLAVVRRIAFTLLRKDKKALSLENKRLKAAMSTDYLEQLLEIKSRKIS